MKFCMHESKLWVTFRAAQKQNIVSHYRYLELSRKNQTKLLQEQLHFLLLL